MPTFTAFPDTMSDADRLMWTIESDPILRSTITAVALLDRRADWGAVQRKVARATEVIPRLRQRVVVPPLHLGSPQWVDDPGFDLRYHLRRIALPASSGLADVVDLACRSAMAGFDRARPLWEFTIVEGLKGGQAAFVQKVHHSATDGIGGVRLLLELLDSEREPQPLAGAASPLVTAPADIRGRDIVRRAVTRSTQQAVDVATGIPRALARTVSRLVLSPASVPGAVVSNARSAARLLAPATAPLSPVMRTRSLRWQFDTFDVDLAILKRAAGTVDGSLNDAFLAAVTGGLRRYHQRHGATVDWLRMTLPVSIRTDADPAGGNRFVPVRFPMPVAEADPTVRMRTAARLVAAWRAEPALGMSDFLAGALSRIPTVAVTRLFGGMLKNVDFVATNIPGLPQPMYIGGAELLRQYAFAPLSGAAINVALLSHVGTCCIGVNSDAAAVRDPAALTSCLQEGFDEVLSVVHAARPAARAY